MITGAFAGAKNAGANGQMLEVQVHGAMK